MGRNMLCRRRAAGARDSNMTAPGSLKPFLVGVARQYLQVAAPSLKILTFAAMVGFTWAAIAHDFLGPALGAAALLLALLCFRELPSPTRYLGGAVSVCALALCALAVTRTAQPHWLNRVSFGLVLIGALCYASIALQHVQFSCRLSKMAASMSDEALMAEMPADAARLARAWIAKEIAEGPEITEALRLATLYAAISIGMKQTLSA